MPTIRASAYSTALILAFLNPAPAHAQRPSETWHYYRPTNTGIQGDYCDAIWVGPDNDPWIGGYDPTFEEGGIAKFVQTDNRWINISNVDYPIIGHPNDTGTSRVSDIVGDANGVLWMATGRGALRFDPAIGPSSLVKFDPSNSELNGGWTEDVDLGPDNTVWFAARSVNWGDGGIARYNVATNTWTGWDAVGDLVSVQRKPGGGYFVWNGTMGNSAAFVQRFDSATQQWTLLPHTGAPGEVIALAGKDCVDDLDNFWALRVTTPGNYHSLDYLRSDGTWVTPPEPYDGVTFDLWAFKAFGQKQALLVDGQNRTWRFNGSTWQDLGIWRPGAFSESVDIDSFGNVWVSGVEGAAKRNAQTGQWQRYRVTNTSQYDFFNDDVAIDPAGGVCACANAGPGVGGMVRFDGTRWIGFNNFQYGLGHPWPMPTDNSESVHVRANGHVAVNPTFNGIHEWTGSQFVQLQPSTVAMEITEDSLGRLWYVGEYFSLQYFNGSTWKNVGIAGWGSKIQKDPDRPGTIWAATGYEIVRTDDPYRFSRDISNFPELTTQSDTFSGLAADHNGIAWIGATVQLGVGGTGGALIRLDANTGAYTMLRYDQGWPLPGQFVSPLAVTPDGRVWMQYDSDFFTAQRGLCWYDGTNVGVYPAPPNGEMQWGGLPHSQIESLRVREIPGGYELWMSCMSRGLAVLTVMTGATDAQVAATSPPSHLVLEPSAPNPFSESTVLRFSLPAAQHVQLGIYDVSGRRVRTLMDREMQAGRFTSSWDGKSDDAQPVSSGVYFWRLKTSGEQASQRVVLQR